MAYYLSLDGIDDYVSIPAVNIGGTVGDYIELDFALNGSDTQVLGRDDGYTDLIEFLSASLVRIRFDSAANYDISFSKPAVDERIKLKLLRYSSSFWYVYKDDVYQGGVDIAGRTWMEVFNCNTLGGINGSAFTGTIDIYGFEIKRGGVIVSYLDPSASGGLGTTLPDTVGTDDGTLINGPVDNSQWVYYSDGGVEVSPTTATAVASSFNPSITSGVNVVTTTGQSSVSSYNLIISTGVQVGVTAAHSTAQAFAPVLISGAAVSPSLAESSATANNPAIQTGVSVHPSAAVSSASSSNPTITTSDVVNITPTASAAIVTALSPFISAGASVTPNTAQIAATAYNPSAGSAAVVSPTIAAAIASANDPGISSGASAIPATALSESQAPSPTIRTGVAVIITTAFSTVAANDPSVTAGVVEYIRKIRLTGTYSKTVQISGQFSKRVTL